MASSILGDAEVAEWLHWTEVSSEVQRLASFSMIHFPSPGSPGSAWRTFLTGSLGLPAAVVLVGAGMACLTLFLLRRVHIKATTGSSRLPWITFVLVCTATLACFAAGIYFCVTEWQKGYTLASSYLAAATIDAKKSEQIAEALNITGHSFTNNLDRLYVECPKSTHQTLQASVEEVKNEVVKYLVAVQAFSNSLQGISDKISLLEQYSRSIGIFVDSCVSSTATILAVCYICIVLVIFLAEFSGPTCIRRCSCLQLPCLGAACIAPAVLLVALGSAMELSIGVMSSAFCINADNITLDYAEDSFGITSTGFNLTRHYITGHGQNPALRDLGLIQVAAQSCVEWVQTYGSPIARSCPKWDLANMSQNLRLLQGSVVEAVNLLEPANVYPYYRSTVHDVICGTSVSQTIWAVLFQLILGFVCLPLLACSASCLLDSLNAERHSSHGFDLLSTEDDEKGWCSS
mmetsp:Transcript_63440/g.112791  ORF Transcript_63440/g.112791 Transcript_63440/m.112791 type:complete len:461 (-) Transcript_63440:49-1431(-)